MCTSYPEQDVFRFGTVRRLSKCHIACDRLSTQLGYKHVQQPSKVFRYKWAFKKIRPTMILPARGPDFLQGGYFYLMFYRRCYHPLRPGRAKALQAVRFSIRELRMPLTLSRRSYVSTSVQYALVAPTDGKFLNDGQENSLLYGASVPCNVADRAPPPCFAKLSNHNPVATSARHKGVDMTTISPCAHYQGLRLHLHRCARLAAQYQLYFQV